MFVEWRSPGQQVQRSTAQHILEHIVPRVHSPLILSYLTIHLPLLLALDVKISLVSKPTLLRSRSRVRSSTRLRDRNRGRRNSIRDLSSKSAGGCRGDENLCRGVDDVGGGDGGCSCLQCLDDA